MNRIATALAALSALAALYSGHVQAQAPVKIAIGMSGWTGFAPLTLADKAGIFKRNGLDVDLKLIPQASRHLALAAGAIQCAATTVETHVAWNANGVQITQILLLDKSNGGDGLAVRRDVASIKDLKGKAIGVDAPGTSPFFVLAYMLKKNGMSMKDIKRVTLSPQAAANAFIAGQNDAAQTYEPYLSAVRDKPEAGKILLTTKDYPVVVDTLGCPRSFLRANPKAAEALTRSWFEALEMTKKEPAKTNEIMGAAVKQTGEQFAKSATFITWQDRAANKQFFAGEIARFSRDAAELLLENGVIRGIPDIDTLHETTYLP
ncbi:MAG: transporter permease [Betaproteobacteria bacterium]|nr:transporter permease [Betaproteobacteria bacterium]